MMQRKKLPFLLEKPGRIFLLSLFLSFLNLTLRGTPLRLWKLHQEQERILNNKKTLEKKLEQLSLKIQRISDPRFIELEAKNRFDLAKKEELIFIFSKKNQTQAD